MGFVFYFFFVYGAREPLLHVLTSGFLVFWFSVMGWISHTASERRRFWEHLQATRDSSIEGLVHLSCLT